MKEYSIKNKLITMLFSIGLLINPVFILGKDNTIKSRTEPIKLLKRATTEEKEKTKELYSQLPMSFEINKGQMDDKVKFFSRGKGYTLFLTDEEAVFSVKQSKNEAKVMRMKLQGSKKTEIIGEGELPGKSNYFIGKDPKKWRTDISHYGKVKYKEVYSGIDLVYYGNGSQMEYDFIVQPGANTANIKMNYDGAEKIYTNKEGELILKVGVQEIKQHKPFIYQEKDGQKIEIAGNYEVKGKNNVGFKIENYDSSKPLVIDPILALEYSTYLGGEDDEIASDIAVDSSGAIYVGGSTRSEQFPVWKPFKSSLTGDDVFITKFSSTNHSNLVYSTYLGGTGSDGGYGIAVDDKSAVYVTGSSLSADFPTTPGAFQKNNNGGDYEEYSNGFITKLHPDGKSLDYSTYLGGKGEAYEGEDSPSVEGGINITVDLKGEVCVIGDTYSKDFPMKNPLRNTYRGRYFDSFIAKLNASGTDLIYSTYFGGSFVDECKDLATDSAGITYVTGKTSSADFPITSDAIQKTLQGDTDSFITKISSDGKLIYSTYFGGADYERGDSIAVNNTGIYLMGLTFSRDFPITPGVFKTNIPQTGGEGSEIFVTKFSFDNKLVYSTYFGGADYEAGYGLAIDSKGQVYITGVTESTDFPLKYAFQSTKKGNYPDDRNVFITKLSSDAQLVYSTYLGGRSSNNLETSFNEVRGIAVDNKEAVYVTGWTNAGDFPLANPFQPTKDMYGTAFVTKLILTCSPDDATISTPEDSVVTNSTSTASVVDAGPGATYTWTVNGANASIISGNGTSNIVFEIPKPQVTGGRLAIILNVTIRTAGGCTASGKKIINVTS